MKWNFESNFALNFSTIVEKIQFFKSIFVQIEINLKLAE